MAKKITQLTSATAGDLTDDDILPVVDSAAGSTKKATRSDLLDDAVSPDSLKTTSALAWPWIPSFATWTPSTNSDNSTATLGDISGSDTITIPSWASKAIVLASMPYVYAVSSANTGQYRVVIGSDNGTTVSRGFAAANDFQTLTFSDEITLTATGSQTIKMQHARLGSGAVRVGSSGTPISILVWYVA